MQAELLYMYVKNNYTWLAAYLAAAGMLLSLKLTLYGLPKLTELGIYVLALLFCGAVLAAQLRFYRKILYIKNGITDCNWKNTAVTIALNKTGYLLPWMFIMFWPLNSPFLYDHLVGYFYVFFAIALYASSSGAFYPLLVYDIVLHLAVIVLVTVLNFEVVESRYAGGIIFAFAVFTLMSARKLSVSTRLIFESRKKMEKAVIAAEKANRAKSDFLAVISHEIRTPMVGIMGMINVLDESDITPEQRDCVNVVQQCSKSLLNTLNDLLDTARMEAGTFELSEVNFDCRSMLLNTSRIIEPLTSGKGIALKVDIDPELPAEIYGDPNRLQQVIVNLLNNAVKFTDKGEVSISARYLKEAGRLRFEITDTGIGIAPKDQKKLFRKFSQADGSISRRYGGTGLGLSITRSLIEMMGGRIDVISAAGKGSTFWLEIPCVDPKPAMAAAPGLSRPEFDKAMRVLLVEDNKINQMVAIRLLEKRGHMVTPAASGAEALKFVQEKTFDIILMDINLPGMDGIDAARRIHDLGASFKKIPIVALSATGSQVQIDACYKAGMIDCIIKPYAPQTLFDILARHTMRGYWDALEARQTETMKAKKEAIEDEMGPDYMHFLLQNTAREMVRLLGEMKVLFREENYDHLRRAAHELKGVSGAVGLESVHAISENLETLTEPELHNYGASLLSELESRITAVKA